MAEGAEFARWNRSSALMALVANALGVKCGMEDFHPILRRRLLDAPFDAEAADRKARQLFPAKAYKASEMKGA